MNSFSCRTKEKRIKLVQEYEIIPISHMVLLFGQEIRSAAEDIITKEYYCFSYKNKKICNDNGTFCVGLYVAKHFLELLSAEPLCVFNPLEYNGNSNKNGKSMFIRNTGINNWNELAVELYNIIHIILMAWNTNEGILADILSKTRKYYYNEPFLSNIKSVNTIIKNGEQKNGKKRSVLGMLEDFKKKGNSIKEYSFPLTTEMLKKNKIQNYITSNGT